MAVTGRTARIGAAMALALLLGGPGSVAAQDHAQMYSAAALEADAQRLKGRFRQIHEVLLSGLKSQERAALANLRLEFPMPQEGDYALEFYAYDDGGVPVIAAPVMSLKAVEDLTLAHAFLHYNKNRYGGVGDPAAAIDLYFAMTRRADPAGLPGGAYPPILDALGIPADAYKNKAVGDLSLSFRNEAFAFVLAHEIGHVVLGHAHGHDPVPAEQSRAEEAAADAFAFDLLSRSGTPAVGAFLFFTAQAYSLPHRGRFATEDEWLTFMRERNGHPLTTDRLRAMAAYHASALAGARPGERAIWRDIAAGQEQVAAILDDRELQDCIAEIGETGDLAALKSPFGATDLLRRAQACRR